MPFHKYEIEPVKLSQNQIPKEERETLECNVNLTLANVIRQLASLSQYSTDLFNDLSNEFKKLNERSVKLHERLTNLKNVPIREDTLIEVKSFHQMTHFKSYEIIDKRLFSPETRANAIKELYDKAEPMPNLSLFNSFNGVDFDSTKLYSDPLFFEKSRKHHRRKKKNPKKTVNEQELSSDIKSAQNVPIIDNTNPQSQPVLYENQQTEFYEDPNKLTFTKEFQKEETSQSETNTQNNDQETNQTNVAYINEQNYYSFTDESDDDF